VLIEDSYTSWKDFYSKPNKAFSKIMQALGVEPKTLKRKRLPKPESTDGGFVMEGGVVEADVAVIEGIAVDPSSDEEVSQHTELVLKEDQPPKVAPGD
jgi:hypothetical protein